MGLLHASEKEREHVCAKERERERERKHVSAHWVCWEGGGGAPICFQTKCSKMNRK
jgi:hypothetical protein